MERDTFEIFEALRKTVELQQAQLNILQETVRLQADAIRILNESVVRVMRGQGRNL